MYIIKLHGASSIPHDLIAYVQSKLQGASLQNTKPRFQQLQAALQAAMMVSSGGQLIKWQMLSQR